MDLKSRNIILKNKEKLSKNLNLSKLQPFLMKSEIFTNAMLRDVLEEQSDYDLFVELTTRGPYAFCQFLKVLNDAGYSEEANFLSLQSSKTVSGKCYEMTSVPLGFCKIINNVKFDDLEQRYGSDKDAESLRLIFEKMDYRVKVENNLTGDEMRLSLKAFSDDECWGSVHSCIVVILSHGESYNNVDVILGTDSDYIEKMEIYKMFDNLNCKTLQDKPKMFFFQACRGKEEDSGVCSFDSSNASKPKVKPSLSDMLVVHSALPNHLSYRDHIKGSWFCQDLVQVLSEEHLNNSLETMLQTVDRKVSNRLSIKQRKQVTHIDKFGIKAHIYFCINSMTESPEFYDPKSTV